MAARICCGALALMVWQAFSAPAGGSDGGPHYAEQVRFARGEHPRIWITSADLPALRQRCAPGGSHARDFARLQEFLDRRADRTGTETTGRDSLYTPVAMSFLYLVTGDRKYARTAKELLLQSGADKYAGVALDWIMTKSDLDGADGEPLSRDELLAIVDRLTRQQTFVFYRSPIDENPFISPWRYRIPGTFFTSLALLHEDVDDEGFSAALHWVIDWMKNQWIPATNRWSRGVYYPGFDYYRYSDGAEAHAAVAWQVAAGEDLFGESIQLREFVRHAFYQHDPRSGVWVHYEQGRSGVSCDYIMPVYRHAHPDPLVRGMAQRMANRYLPETFWSQPEAGNWGTVVVKIPWLWQRILWHDPHAPEVDLDAIPTAAHWPGNGYSSMRSGWDRDDTILFFVAGDHVNEHQRLLQGHFGIYRKGWLATTSSSYDSCTAPDSHYGFRTIANNCLLVHDPEEVFWAGYGELRQLTNDGGQYMFSTGDFAWGGDWRKRHKDDIWNVADTVAFESQPLFDYVAGDLTNAYRRELKDSFLKTYGPERRNFTPQPRPDKLTRATRQIVYLKPDLFVMFDRVDAVDPQFTKTWLLHTMNEPEIDGSLLRVLPDEGAAEFDGALITAEHDEGKLMVRRLLPETAITRKRGGEGFEAWSGGRNWPHRSGRLYGWEYAALWRVETEPVERRRDDVFLHVLYACDRGTDNARMPRAETIARGDDPGVRIGYAGRVYEVIFQRDGGRACAGHITITEDGRTLVDRPLADRVVPTFEVLPSAEDPRLRRQ